MAKPNLALLERIYSYVESHPGCAVRDVCRGISYPEGGLDGRLASMENVGLFLSEDSEGDLYPYSKYGEKSEWASGIGPLAICGGRI